MMIKVFRGDIARLGRCTEIVTQGESEIKRSKPFKYTYEKEIVMYAYFKKLDYFSTECIYSPNAYRGYARTFLKDLESVRPSAIIGKICKQVVFFVLYLSVIVYISLDIIHSGEAFEIKSDTKMPTSMTCTRCGYMSSNSICKACMLLEGLNRGLPQMGIGKQSKAVRLLYLDYYCLTNPIYIISKKNRSKKQVI